MKIKRKIQLTWLLFALAAAPCIVALAEEPLRLAIESKAHSVTVGDSLDLQCVMLSAKNTAVAAPRNFAITVQATSARGTSTNFPIVIKAGQNSCDFHLEFKDMGITEVSAKQIELQGASTYVRVKPLRPASSVPLNSAPYMKRIVVPTSPQTRITPATATVFSAPSRPAKPPPPNAPPPSAPAPSSANIAVVLKYQERTYLADGNDCATVTAFLDADSGEAPQDIQITLFDNLGTMLPTPLLIPKGQDFAEAKITSDKVGTASIDYINSVPKVALHSDTSIHIRFGPPIVALQIQSSPANVSLLETASVVVRLVDAQQKPTETDEPRQVQVTIQSNGRLSANTLTIPAGCSSTNLTFYPTQLGSAVLSASVDNLLSQTASITIYRPTALLISSLLGGLIGGLIAASVTAKRRKDKTAILFRVLLGGATGFVLYYFLILGFITQIPAALALNPFGALFISLIGGWCGTEVFAPICRVLVPKSA